jgi:hypothetical protein
VNGQERHDERKDERKRLDTGLHGGASGRNL